MYETIEKRFKPWRCKRQTKTLNRLQICSWACVHACDALNLKSEYSMKEGTYLLYQQNIIEGIKGINNKERRSKETKEDIENLKKEFRILMGITKQMIEKFVVPLFKH